MTKGATNYLFDAIEVLRANVTPLFLLGLIGLLFYVPSSSGELSGFALFLPVIVLFIVYPLIYGRYTEIIQGNAEVSYSQIFNKHWFNFFVVSIVVGSPVLLVTFLGFLLGKHIVATKTLLSLLIDVLSIYIFPLVFLLSERVSCISLGIKCLLGNFKFSIPLVVLTLMPSILDLLIRNPFTTSDERITAFFTNYFFWLFGILFDFVIFIASTLILKEKLSITNKSQG